MRLLLLTFAGTIIFCGFAAPFLYFGALGFTLAAVLITAGGVLLFIFERRTAAALKEDTGINRLLDPIEYDDTHD